MRLRQYRVLVLLFASLFAGQLFAMWDGHFLLGVQSGIATRSGDLNVDITHPAPAGVTHTVRTHDDTGFIWAVVMGYEWLHAGYLIGLEGTIGGQDYGDEKAFAFPDTLGNRYNAKASFNRQTVLALSTRFGYRLTPWIMSYMRLGAETSNDVIRYDAAVGAGPGPVVSVNLDNGTRGIRFLAGFGFEFPSLYNTVVRLEYNYSSRGRGTEQRQYATDSMTVFEGKMKPLQHALLASFVWNFNPEDFVRASS